MSEIATSVQHLETTASPDLPSDYQKWRRRNMEPEWLRTESLYRQTDDPEKKSRLEKLQQCRKFASFARHSDTGKIRILSNSCRQRWCPICARVRSLQLSRQVTDWLSRIPKPKYVTLTYAHSSRSLEEQVSALYNHFRLFRQRVFIRNKWRGGLWFFQVKRSKDTGEWHPHLHCIVDGDYIPQSELSLEWLYTTETSFVVDIRAIRESKTTADYVARYCARPVQLSELSESDSVEVFHCFHGKRLCGTWGTGKHCSLRPPKVPDAAKWVHVGGYTDVIQQKYTLHRAKAVLDAFVNDTILPLHIDIGKPFDPMDPTNTRQSLHFGIEDVDFNVKEFP